MESPEPSYLIMVMLWAFIALPLVVHLPVYLYRFVKLRRLARKRGETVELNMLLLTLNLWVVLTWLFTPGLEIHPGSGPLYLMPKAKCAEAKINLGAIYFAQMAYYGAHNTYAGRAGVNGTGAFADLGWMPTGNTIYAYYAGKDSIPPIPATVQVRCRLDKDWPIADMPESTVHGFTIVAVGNVDQDPCLDVWTINDTKELRNIYNDTSNAGACVQCPMKAFPQWANQAGLYQILEIMDRLRHGYTTGSSTCLPFMFIVVPLTYFLALRENRRYREALAAMGEAETADSSPQGGELH